MDGRRVVLHIGAPKSGTTSVQSRLHRNAASLLAHDVLVPRAGRAEGPASLAFRAALDLTGVRLGRGRGYTDGWWDRLVESIAAYPGTSVVSDEAFVRADDAAAARAVGELAATGARVEVVYTARDLARQLVSGWLEGLKHGGTESLATYLARAERGELKPMRAYELPTVLGRWASALGDPSRLHLVTVPGEGGDRSLLWTRFAGVAGIEADWTPDPAARSNAAVGLVEAQLLRLVNERLDGATRRGGLLHGRVRAAITVPDDDVRVRIDPRYGAWAGELTEAWLGWVVDSGVDVVGDLDELRPEVPDADAWRDPDDVPDDVVEAADRAAEAVRAGRVGAGG